MNINETEAREVLAVGSSSKTTSIGEVFCFPASNELPGVGLEVSTTNIVSDIGIGINERGFLGFGKAQYALEGAISTNINLHTMKYLNLGKQITVMRFKYSEAGSMVGGFIEVSNGEDLTLLRRGYDVSLGSRIALIDGADYDFVAGIEEKRVFVDGWLKEGEIQKFRVTVPREDSEEYMREVLASQAKLFILEFFSIR